MSIKTRLIALLSFFFALILAIEVAVNVWISKAKHTSHHIHSANELRLFSQMIAKEALFGVVGIDRQSALDKDQKAAKAALRLLLDGDRARGITPVNDAKIRAELSAVQGFWSEYTEDVEALSISSTAQQLRKLADDSVFLTEETDLVVSSLEEHASRSLAGLRIIIVASLGLSLIAAIGGFFYLRVFIIQRIEHMRAISNAIVDSKDLTKRIAMTEHDEIAETAAAFDRMVESFTCLNHSTREVEQQLHSQLDTLSITSQENKNSMDIQRAEIMQVSTAVNEMATTVQEVARNTQDAATIAAQAQEQANHGSELLEASMTLTHALADEVRGASKNIEKLALASDSIGGIADTISTIAEQTNLLALNAAIEAARAGEQGRGFAVVADEVRTLAQRTQEATSEIHKLISTLHDTTRASVDAMENSRIRSDQGVEQAENMSVSLKTIIESVQNLGDINHQIAVAAEEQSAVADEINQNILSIESKAESTYANAEANAEYTENLSVMAQRLRERLLEYHVS